MSFLTILYLTIVVVIEFFVRKSDYAEAVAHAPPARINVFSIFLVVPLVLFAYTCHPNVLPIYVELKRQTVKRMNWILFIALFLVMAFYLLVGVFGFLTFYSKYSVSDFPGEILIAYKDGGVLTTVCSWTILLTVLTASPLLVHPCRDFTIVFFWKTRTIPKLKYLGVVTGICLLALVLSISIPSITIIFTLVGSVSSPFICYIIPCMYYLRLFPAKWYSPWTLV
jgi:amino acid permease